eukprot:COSAG06_NODE_9855_length_1803_cov_4.801056_1_plen_37_part_10
MELGACLSFQRIVSRLAQPTAAAAGRLRLLVAAGVGG